jgi:hypothetical protein
LDRDKLKTELERVLNAIDAGTMCIETNVASPDAITSLRACLEIEILREIYEKGTAPSPCCVSKTRMEPHPWMGEIIPAI